MSVATFAGEFTATCHHLVGMRRNRKGCAFEPGSCAVPSAPLPSDESDTEADIEVVFSHLDAEQPHGGQQSDSDGYNSGDDGTESDALGLTSVFRRQSASPNSAMLRARIICRRDFDDTGVAVSGGDNGGRDTDSSERNQGLPLADIVSAASRLAGWHAMQIASNADTGSSAGEEKIEYSVMEEKQDETQVAQANDDADEEEYPGLAEVLTRSLHEV